MSVLLPAGEGTAERVAGDDYEQRERRDEFRGPEGTAADHRDGQRNEHDDHRERADGRSGYTLRKLLRLWINGFTAFSVVPLRVATLCGFFCALLGFLGVIWCIFNKLIRPEVPMGYSSMMTTIVFIGGIMMLMLGMIGEYIGRTYICINKAPQYVIRQTISEPPNEQ